MTRLWERRTHKYLLVLTVLRLMQTSWTFDGHERETPRKISGSPGSLDSNELSDESVDVVIGSTVNANTLQYYLSHWNESIADSVPQDDITYYGEGLSDVFFHSSAENNSLILRDLSRCLYEFQFITCLKFLLVSRLDNLLDYLRDNNLTRADFSFANGVVSFKSAAGVNNYDGRAFNDELVAGIDEDITQKMMELFRNRSLRVNLLPGLGLDMKPVAGGGPGDFVSFRTRPYMKWNFWRNDAIAGENEGRGNNKRKKGGFQMPPLMMLPQLIMIGFMPFALANLQAMVMNAFMLNMMALNSAIFMTIRNLVFGPRGGPKIKYVNYGYRKKKKKSSVPTIIVHSPAAFVKQPFHKFRKKPHNYHHSHPHHGPPVDLPPKFHHHLHYEQIFYDKTPIKHAEIYEAKPGIIDQDSSTGNLYEDPSIEYADIPIIHGHVGNVQVFQEDGELDGKNRVRIKIKDGGPNVKELLHRVRSIEKYRKKFKPSVQYEIREEAQEVDHNYSQSVPGFDPSSADDTPWTVPDHIPSHSFSDTHPLRPESDYVISHNENEFTPTHRHKVRH